MMDIRPIKSEQDYEHALARVDELMDAEPGTHEGDELEVLATLVESYEDKHFPIESPDPVEAILFRMEEMDLTRKDLEPYLGSRHRVSEVLNRKRELSLNMIRRLHEGLGIPIENLIGKAA
jgi:HTH-type transcriptional regulator/antitoxin HigA